MVQALLYILLAANAVAALALPWIGVVSTYVMSLLTPQNIWWWAFGDIRPAFWVIIPTLTGTAIAMLRGRINYSNFNTKLNWCVLILWVSFTISYYFGPFVDVFNQWRFYDVPFMFSLLQKTYLTYLVAVLLIDSLSKLKYASVAIILTTLYMTYWANSQYLIYHHFGRMSGPVPPGGYSIYADENIFAVLFVVGAPFLYYFGTYLSNRILRWLVWAFVPLSWHAIFLTASRGALLGVVAVLAVFAFRVGKKSVALLVVCGFVVAFVWQAGAVMRDRSETIDTSDESAAARVEAWGAAVGMMAAHPLTGVGFASFGQAFSTYSDKRPRIAHNTFFQVGGEWGVTAAVTYLVLIFSTLNRLRKNGRQLRLLAPDPDAIQYYYLNESCLLGLVGFFVCSMFLSLEQYEIFYYLLVIANGVLVGSRRLGVQLSPAPAATVARAQRGRITNGAPQGARSAGWPS